MELTIHIGPHKTGTTAIQSAFARAARQIRREGVLYPVASRRDIAHHNLAFALKEKSLPHGRTPDADEELDLLIKSLARFQGDRALISSEEFFACAPAALARLRDRLQTPVRVICFLRRPDEFLISSYNQKIKQPGNRFAYPFRKYLSDPRSIAPEINYLKAISSWADTFGDDAIEIDTYEGPSPVARLWSRLGLSGSAPDTRLNPSVPGVVVELMRHAKLFGMSEAKQRKLLARAATTFRDYPPFYLSDDDRKNIIGAFESETTQVFARFGMDNPYRLDAYQAQPPVPREYNITLQDVMKLLDEFL